MTELVKVRKVMFLIESHVLSVPLAIQAVRQPSNISMLGSAIKIDQSIVFFCYLVKNK